YEEEFREGNEVYAALRRLAQRGVRLRFLKFTKEVEVDGDSLWELRRTWLFDGDGGLWIVEWEDWYRWMRGSEPGYHHHFMRLLKQVTSPSS
ncbi:MAG: hypothetical protein DRJ67_05195, partial [Thermoprotei archaeon]